jgi:MinD-like ATPase involved in chromosome partitioning or flagellar assembly
MPDSRRGRRRRATKPVTAGFGFDRVPGTVVAVCGLAGGAGTTTLAYRLALQAARESPGPVLACESEAVLGGLAVITGRAARHGLGGLADQVENAALADSPAVELGAGLHLTAAMPRPSPVVSDAALAAVVAAARQRHTLVVVDCRTIEHPHARALLLAASHIVWTLPSSRDALQAAETLHSCGVLPRAGSAREALVAMRTRPDAQLSMRDLTVLAGRRHERLIICPYVRALAAGGALAGELDELSALLTQLATFLGRGQ